MHWWNSCKKIVHVTLTPLSICLESKRSKMQASSTEKALYTSTQLMLLCT